MALHIGFTGTQAGMTFAQFKQLQATLDNYKNRGQRIYFHHGDCVGADAEAAEVAHFLGYEIFVHPPTKDDKRAHTGWGIHRPPRPYLARNREIVRESQLMIAAPKERQEQLRSGTWATIRTARKLGRELVIIWPDGETSREPGRGLLTPER